jgi:hypothetical protein
VTLEDAKRSFKIFGPHVMKGKGNAVKKTTKLQQSNIVAFFKNNYSKYRDDNNLKSNDNIYISYQLNKSSILKVT